MNDTITVFFQLYVSVLKALERLSFVSACFFIIELKHFTDIAAYPTIRIVDHTWYVYNKIY